jgi:hypothetical protein
MLGGEERFFGIAGCEIKKKEDQTEFMQNGASNRCFV